VAAVVGMQQPTALSETGASDVLLFGGVYRENYIKNPKAENEEDAHST
jgi:hypothetical protein